MEFFILHCMEIINYLLNVYLLDLSVWKRTYGIFRRHFYAVDSLQRMCYKGVIEGSLYWRRSNFKIIINGKLGKYFTLHVFCQ